jgi:predicted nucleic acid-binding protein
MKRLKIYLDTSVISYLQQEDAPERMKDTLALWKQFERLRAKKNETVFSK